MKNHCGESVGFQFRNALWFPRWFCLCEVSETLFSPSTVMILLVFLSCLLFFFFRSLRTKGFFSIKGNCCVFELSVPCVYLFHCVIATEFELQPVQSTAASSWYSLNVKHAWITIEKSKAILSAILYHVDISKRYFLVCHLKIAFYFLHELKQRSSDVTGRH